MKGKPDRVLIFSILVILWLASLYLGIKISYPPYENELAILISAKLTQPNPQLDEKSQQVISSNILGQEQNSSTKLFPLRTLLQIPVGTKNVFSLRVVNFLLITASLIVFYFLLKEGAWATQIPFFALALIVTSPLVLSTWLFRPKICLTILLVLFWLYLWTRKKVNPLTLILLASIPVLLLYSSFQGSVIALLIFAPLTILRSYQARKHLLLFIFITVLIILATFRIKNPAFKHDLAQITLYDTIKSGRIEKEINERVIREDNLLEKVSFPLWFRRLGYNKVFITYRNTTREILSFLDLEALFFQEVHPLQQKSEVIFYWPEIFPFIIGVLAFLKDKNRKRQKDLSILVLFSFTFYLLTPHDSTAGKHVFTLLPLSIVIGQGLKSIPRNLFLVIIPLLAWAIITNAYDILKRPLFWYDNRPYVYAEGLRALQDVKPRSENIYFTSLIGNPKAYYFYYFSPDPLVFLEGSSSIRDNHKTIYFSSFDLKNESPQEDSLYFGFLGEFIGPNIFNEFSPGDIDKIKELGLKIEKAWKTNDTIAFKYSNDFFLASYLDQNQE